MLAKTFKFPLRQHPDFFDRAQRLYSPLFTAWFMPHTELQVAAVVSSKTTKSAVERNALKRQLYAAWEKALPEFKNLPFVVVLTSRKETLRATPAELSQALVTLLHKLAARKT